MPKPVDSSIFPPDIRLGETATKHQLQEYRATLAELAKRRIEALRLYEPSPFQERFHSCDAKEALIQAGNQVGKSMAAFAEDARAATGQDPYGKYPKENGVMVCLGMDEAHIGRVIHKYLFRAGAFRIIRDEKTHEWRSWKPWLPEDMARKDQTKPAPPLIPRRYIKRIAWRKRAQHVFDQVELHNGWVIYAMSSKGEPGQGFQADLVHIDEDLERPEWYDEMIARLTMRDGKLRWSALPHAKNDAMVNLVTRAEDEAHDERPSTVVIRATVFDNPYMPATAREENIKRWKAKGDDEYRKRALGEMVIDSVLMYPTFNRDLHSVFRPSDPNWTVGKLLSATGGDPPDDWCRYMVVDPGYTVCAVTFWAVPPPEVGDHAVCYDELYMQHCTAAMFGTEVEKRAKNRRFEDFIIDAHGGRLRSIESGITPREQYSKELERRGVVCERSGSGFRDGCDNIESREEALRLCLSVRPEGTPKFLINPERCPNTVREFQRFKRKVVGGVVQDEGNRRMPCHAVETCFDDKTEVLTKTGWKLFSDASLEDELATVNLESSQLEYSNPLRLIAHDYSGEMIRFDGLKLDACVTPDHRMVCLGRESREVSIRKAGDVRRGSDLFHAYTEWRGESPEVVLIPRISLDRGRRVCLEKEIDPLLFAEFLGWYVSEGSADKTVRVPGKGYRVNIAQNPGPKRELIRAMLKQLPWNAVEVPKGFVLSSKQLWTYLRPLGNKYEKFVPQWIKDANPEIIRRFLTSAVMGDGWVKGSGKGAWAYGTSSRRLADDIQELFMKIGTPASVLSRQHSPRESMGRLIVPTCAFYQVNQWSKPVMTLRDSRNAPNFYPEQYDGRVYCATVPNGTLVVRRNGKPLIAGNCEYAAAHGMPYVRPRPRHAAGGPMDRVLAARAYRSKQRQARANGPFAGKKTVTLGPTGSA